MIVSIPTQERIAALRQKSRDNTLTLDEMREAITLMRGDRVRAAATSAKARAPKPEAIDVDKLLDF